MTKLALLAPLALALAASSFGSANAETKHPKKEVRTHHYVRTVSQPMIACTVLGCAPVPRGCHPETGYTLDGIPFGYDVIACR